MKIRDEISSELPDQCRDCPVVKRYEHLLRLAEYEGKHHCESAAGLLDEAETLGPGPGREALHPLGMMEGEMAVEMWDWELEIRANLSQITSEIDNKCPGSIRGTRDQNKLFRFLDFVTGERSCRNPHFIKFIGDRAIYTQLKEGNWRPGLGE